MIDPENTQDHQPQQLVDKTPASFGDAVRRGLEQGEPMVKVLNADGLLLAKVLPAGGPLLGQEPCPACGHFPGEARDNPFRACVTCWGKPE